MDSPVPTLGSGNIVTSSLLNLPFLPECLIAAFFVSKGDESDSVILGESMIVICLSLLASFLSSIIGSSFRVCLLPLEERSELT